MYTHKLKNCLVAFFIAALCLTAVSAEPVQTFTIMTEEWNPYNFQKDGVQTGISTDILVLMLKEIDSSQGRGDIKALPWARAYLKIQKEPNTLLFTTARTQDREGLFKWVGPIFSIEYNIYALKTKKVVVNSFEALRTYDIGTVRDDVRESLLAQKMGLRITDFERVSTNIQNTKKLFLGRVDLIVQSNDTLLSTCKEAGLNPNEVEPVFSLEKKEMYYAFHKETSDSVIAKFQTAFESIKKQGKVAAIFHRYGK